MATRHTRAVHEVTTSADFERFARAGYVARGVIYTLMGILAIQLARGVAARPPEPGGRAAPRRRADVRPRALLGSSPSASPATRSLRFTQAFVGRTPEAGRYSACDRIAAFASGCAYAIFFGLAISLLVGSAGGNSGGGAQEGRDADALRLARRPLAIVFAAGALFIGVAAYQGWMGVSRRFLRYTKTERMSRTGLPELHRPGRRRPLRARHRVRPRRDLPRSRRPWSTTRRRRSASTARSSGSSDHAYGTVALVAVASGSSPSASTPSWTPATARSSRRPAG